ncbi:MAG TPA: glycosyl transferase, partial [Bacteroidales bacterium]|nr:glycosyl transferase [Bacteroidales bacterium]
MSSPLVLLSAFLITLAITWLVRIYAIKKSIVDIPNERSSHTISTPRGGGIAIVLVWMAGLSYLFVKGEIETNLFLALSSGMVLFVISLIDDVIDLKPAIRMAAQSVSVATALYFIGGVQSIDFGFFVFNHVWINTFLAFIGLIWFINLFNFLDGIDGYASAETILISLAFFALFTDYFLLILVFSTLGFLVWNWQSAKIFMGDVGSTVL